MVIKMMEHDLYRMLPGKSGENEKWLPLWMHIEDTAQVMQYLCTYRVPDCMLAACGMRQNEFARVAEFLARLHDIGKCTPLFIAKLLRLLPALREWLEKQGLFVPPTESFEYPGESPHALAGEAICRAKSLPEGVCAVVGAHHGVPSAGRKAADNLLVHPENYYGKQRDGIQILWQQMQTIIIESALHNTGYSSVEELPELSQTAQLLLSGLLIQADWIASNQVYFSLLNVEERGTDEYRQDRFARALELLNLPPFGTVGEIPENAQILYYDRFGFSPNEMQQVAVSTALQTASPHGLMVIEAQMGVGKTEAALAVAEVLSARAGCGGIFFGLPTQATTNGIFPRLTQWAEKLSRSEKHSIRLIHAAAELNDEYCALFQAKNETPDEEGGLTVHPWFSGKKQALLADFVIGTVDTALMAALSQRHVMLRHLGLSGKTVIVDECHAYDAYMCRYLLRLLQWLGAYQVPVILLSATLPISKKRQMIAAYQNPFCSYGEIKNKAEEVKERTEGYPIITYATREDIREIPVKTVSQQITVQIERFPQQSLTGILKKRLADGGCAGVLVNTVKRAQSVWEQLIKDFPDFCVLVYHAQFLAQERIRRENELMKLIGKHSTPESRNRVIVVGTQVLEQSLDIDFDYLVTDLCPMDLLLQRIGRLHRHTRNRPSGLQSPVCAVFSSDEYEPGAKKIYGEWLLRQTEQQLPDQICLPVDIPGLVNAVYAEPTEEEKKDPVWQEYATRTELSEERAGIWLLNSPIQSRRPGRNTIVGLLDHPLDSEKSAEAKVREGTSSIDVLVMYRQQDGYYSFCPWLKLAALRGDEVPAQQEARTIARQRLRLPLIFGVGKNAEEAIRTLEAENRQYLAAWQESPWIKGDLVLILDRDGTRELCGYQICYTRENGLSYERMEK